MSSSTSLLLSCLLLLLLRCAGAAELTVGDEPFGWDTGINYAAWAQKHAFTVGDVLVFQYVRSQHNVYEVTEAAFRSCDVGGGEGVVRTYASGYDRVGLAENRAYWFICNVPGHCSGGQRLAVNVSAAAAGGGRPSPSVPPLPGPASPAGGGRQSWVAWTTLAIAVINWTP